MSAPCMHAGGVIAVVSGDDYQTATASLQWRQTGQSAFKPGQPLSRIDATHFAGSLFWLNPATSYDVQVTVSSPDGVTGAASQTAALQTRSDVMVEPTVQSLYVAPTGDDGNPGGVGWGRGLWQPQHRHRHVSRHSTRTCCGASAHGLPPLPHLRRPLT